MNLSNKNDNILKYKNSKSTKNARITGGIDGRNQKKRYIKLKSFALEREKQNFSKLFIIHEKDEWWKMIGHSAIIFHYEISNRIGVSSRLHSDDDFEFKSSEGVLNFRNIDMLDEKLVAAKILPIDIKDDYRVYNIGRKYTQADIEFLKKSKELEWAKVNKIILPKESYPNLFSCLRELLNRIYFITRTLDPYAREAIGRAMLEKASEMIRNYSLFANDAGFKDEGLDEIELGVRWIIAQMAVISELRLLPVEKIFRLLRTAEKVERCIEQCKIRKR